MKKTTKKKPEPTWTTAKGEVLAISKMESSHLQNAHRMLRRQPWLKAHATAIANLEEEMMRRGIPALPVFLSSYEEAAHHLKKVALATQRASEIFALTEDDDRMWRD